VLPVPRFLAAAQVLLLFFDPIVRVRRAEPGSDGLLPKAPRQL